MIEVTKDRFYEIVGPLDVHPYIQHGAKWDQDIGYISNWKLRNQKTIGKSYGNLYKKYFLIEELAG